MSGATDQLRRIATRIADLAELLEALAATSERGRLQEGALRVAAGFAGDTYNTLDQLIESEVAHGAAR